VNNLNPAARNSYTETLISHDFIEVSVPSQGPALTLLATCPFGQVTLEFH
jgi:hypothetical protein